jgi:hypothetical protein
MTRRDYAINSVCVRVFKGIKDLRERMPDCRIAHIEIRQHALESMSSGDFRYHDVVDHAETTSRKWNRFMNDIEKSWNLYYHRAAQEITNQNRQETE